MSAHALLRRAKQMDGLKPLPQWDMTALENGSHLHVELPTARRALQQANPSAGTFQAVRAPDRLTVRADRSVRPQLGLYEGISSLFTVKPCVAQNGLGHGRLQSQERIACPLGLATIKSPLPFAGQDQAPEVGWRPAPLGLAP